MKLTTIQTKKRAEQISMFLYGSITFVYVAKIKQGELECSDWIKRLENKYNVII